MKPARLHTYRLRTTWTGNRGDGTATLVGYSRDHEIAAFGKPTIEGSSDASFRGDPSRWNPEELLLASVSACHELWYLGLCAQAGVTVLAYIDDAEGSMQENADGAGQFVQITLMPRVTLTASADQGRAIALHKSAHEKCFIARSVNFPIVIKPTMVLCPP
jgi:organic hydroperoxide reductase OsmC/OhrA